MDPRISILIVSRSNSGGLARALASIAAHCREGVEVIVLCNDATPETRTVALDAVGVRTVESDVNLGVAGGFNAAREAACGEYLMLTHDDVIVQPGWLDELAAYLDATPSAGIVGSRVLELGSGEVQLSGGFLHSDMWVTHVTDLLAPDHIASLEPRRVDFVSSSSMMVRASVWDAIGGCDEGLYPAMFVDCDLCLSARRIGCDVVVVPRSQLRHARGTSTATDFRRWVLARNTKLMLRKWGDELERFHEPGGRAMEWLALRAQDRALIPRPVPARLPVPAGDRATRHREMAAALQADWEAAGDDV